MKEITEASASVRLLLATAVEYWPSVMFVPTSGQYSPVQPSRSVSKKLKYIHVRITITSQKFKSKRENLMMSFFALGTTNLKTWFPWVFHSLFGFRWVPLKPVGFILLILTNKPEWLLLRYYWDIIKVDLLVSWVAYYGCSSTDWVERSMKYILRKRRMHTCTYIHSSLCQQKK